MRQRVQPVVQVVDVLCDHAVRIGGVVQFGHLLIVQLRLDEVLVEGEGYCVPLVS